MSRADQSLPDGVVTHTGQDRRLLVFYALVSAVLLTLMGGLAWQQLLRADVHDARERQQGLRRVLVPGPRGRIFDREGRLLAGSRPRFAVTLALDELGREFRAEYQAVRQNFRAAGEKDVPTTAQLEQIARTSVVRRYLESLDSILGRQTRLDTAGLQAHFSEQSLLPYVLLNDLTPEEYARLLEQLPVNSPMQVFASSVREYPFARLAAHTLGYVSAGVSREVPEDFPGEKLATFQLKDMAGRDGLEYKFEEQLMGGVGGVIFRVTPSGYRINPPRVKLAPTRGRDLVTSLDADLQAAAESGLDDLTGAAVALDVRTGEVLVLASSPNYNLQDFTPRLGSAASDDITARGAWFNRAVTGFYPPGSTFKLLTSIAALRAGVITPEQLMDEPCDGRIRIGNTWKTCDNGDGHHGAISLSAAIAESCDVFFYQLGLQTQPERIAAEARRFHLASRPAIELPNLSPKNDRSIIPEPAWFLRTHGRKISDGDTANIAIGQGDVLVTPLTMACFAASLARDEIFTQPTLLHDPGAPAQHHERTGLTPEQRTALLDGMEGCTMSTSTVIGTARILTAPSLRIPGLQIAGKTGTAQVKDRKNIAWFICFAPRKNPQIAIAVAIEGQEAGETFAGGAYAAPVAQKILRKWSEKQARAAATAGPPMFTLPLPAPAP